jgi:hypothetical protein
MTLRNSIRAAVLAIFLVSAAAAAYTGDYLATMATNKWIAFPSTQLLRVTPDLGIYTGIGGASGVYAIMDAWSSGVFDTKRNRLVVWGGGHNDYWGNEVYAFDVDSLQWIRLTDPCPNPNLCGQVNPDGSANVRHTYGGLNYLTKSDRFWACGGCPACPGGGCGLNDTWTFNFTSLKWQNMSPSGSNPRTYCEDNSAYDSLTNKVYYFDGNGGFYSYDCSANTWSQINNDTRYNYSCVVDPKRKLLFSIGHGDVSVYDIGKSNFTAQHWTTTGGDAFIAKGAVGLDYDPVLDQIVGWHGGSVYALNPDTKVWTPYTAPNAPTPSPQGTYGRWRYVPKYNVYISANNVGVNTYFYKLTAGGGNAVQAGKTPVQPQILQAFPNPFGASTAVQVPRALMGSNTVLYLTDIRGKALRKFDAARIKAGPSEGSGYLMVESGKLQNGVYFLKINGNGKSASLKLLLAR